jgi:hypothetical protein
MLVSSDDLMARRSSGSFTAILSAGNSTMLFIAPFRIIVLVVNVGSETIAV